MQEKRCRNCGIVKPVSDFRLDHGYVAGRCRRCQNAILAAYKRKHATPEARWAAVSKSARAQMLAQEEAKRQAEGRELGYSGAHRRVRRLRGRAADQVCVDCGVPAQHWAYIHDTDPTEPDNYQPMCRRCHFRYDQVGARSVATKGAERRSAAAHKAWATKRAKRAALDR